MVLTPDKFVKTEFGLGVGILLAILAVISLLRGTTSAKRTPTGTVVALASLVLGSYIIARFYGYDI